METRLIFIGTLHCGFTPNEELETLIADYSPDRLLVEICQSDIEAGKIDDYPPEMRFVLDYARKHDIPVFGFDSKINVLKAGVDAETEKKVVESETEFIKRHDWKDFNNDALNRELDEYESGMIDRKKWDERELELKQNIKQALPSNGTIMIICGSGHIGFFEKNFPSADFPLRN